MAAIQEGEAQDREYVGDGLKARDIQPIAPIEKLKRTRALLENHIREIDAILDMEIKAPGFLELSKTVRKFL